MGGFFLYRLLLPTLVLIFLHLLSGHPKRSWHLSSAATLQDKRNLGLPAEPSVWSAMGATAAFPAAIGTCFHRGGQIQGRANFCSLVVFSSVPSPLSSRLPPPGLRGAISDVVGASALPMIPGATFYCINSPVT